MSYNNPQQVYFDSDGCWGTADEGYFVVLDTTRWVQEDWDAIDSCRDGERMALARKITHLRDGVTVSTCVHCHRDVALTDEGWADENATGDDSLWRLVCDENGLFPAIHEATT